MTAEGESGLRLKGLCFLAVTENFSALSAHAAAVLPCDLLEELQPHLTVVQLDQIQPMLNSRGLSTLSTWKSILRQILGPSGAQKSATEDEAKVQVMKTLFTSVLYNSRNDFIISNFSSLSTPSFLSTAARHIEIFTLRNQPELRKLTMEWRCVLQQLESHIRCVKVSHSLDPSYTMNWPALMVLHRLLDHGQITKVSFHARCSLTLAWILGTLGSQTEGSDDHESSAKKLKLDPRCFPQPGRGDEPLRNCWGDQCPRRSLESLELGQCENDCLDELCKALPSCSSLRTLNLHSIGTFTELAAEQLIGALQQQSRSAGAGLTHLEVCSLPCISLLEQLLEACPHLQSLTADVHSRSLFTDRRPPTENKDREPTEFPLLKLRISMTQQNDDDDEVRNPGPLIRTLLRHCSRLQSLHVSGLRLKSKASYGRLLNTLSKSCRSLECLTLEDVNLSDSLEHVLFLLKRCHFTDLTLKDCRLLDKCSERRGDSLKRLSSALVDHRSLRSVCLAQNRIARHVPVLAQLFSPDSSLLSVDLSCNFIQAADLLEFSRHIEALRPNRRLTLNLRRNPGDRDPDRWRSAISSLAPYCDLLLDGWCSTNTMVDHVSNM